MTEPRAVKVLITGASGNLGSKIRAHLETLTDYQLVLLDRHGSSDGSVIEADLRRYRASWIQHFQGVRVVLHLAANPNPHDAWPLLVEDNVDSTINVYEAAVANGVTRVVFASSLHAVLGNAGAREKVAADMPSNPANFYGATKAVGEHLGKSYAEKYGLSVICLRIGFVRRGDNAAPHDHPDLAVQRRWLSNADLCQAMRRAITAPDVRFAVCNVTSRIAGSHWELESARTVLGFDPRDEHTPLPPTAIAKFCTRCVRFLRTRWARLAPQRQH